MTEETKNPIAFNPDTMTLSQVKECTKQLSVLIDLANRIDPSKDDPDTIDAMRLLILSLRGLPAYYSRRWERR